MRIAGPGQEVFALASLPLLTPDVVQFAATLPVPSAPVHTPAQDAPDHVPQLRTSGATCRLRGRANGKPHPAPPPGKASGHQGELLRDTPVRTLSLHWQRARRWPEPTIP